MISLIDTSFFVALSFPKDRYHEAAKLAKSTMKGLRIVSAPVLSELFYVVSARMNYEAAQKAFQLASSAPFQLEALTKSDLDRRRGIMQKYA
jgi:predicted nucleic acid-binding protein